MKVKLEDIIEAMELESLYACFPDFSKDEIADIYNKYKENHHSLAEDMNDISINCS